MADDQYRLEEKSDAELHDWVAGHKPGSAKYTAGIQESMRRVAIIEEIMEINEAPVRKRELLALCVAIASIAMVIIAIIASY